MESRREKEREEIVNVICSPLGKWAEKSSDLTNREIISLEASNQLRLSESETFPSL